MNAVPDAPWLNHLIAALQGAQLALLRLLDALGLVDRVHGQPAWPWAQRLSGENLLIDLGQARQLGWTAAFVALALLAVLIALPWRRPRPYLLALVPMLLIAAPWPDARVVLVPATPASFHASPTGFSSTAIARGAALYAQHCSACHGEDGRGQGALAASQRVWPPNLTGPLLWRRADGDLLWHILQGTRGRDGAPTMPAFGAQLGADDAWALIDFMKAQGAGRTLQAAGLWAQPVGLPDAQVRCEGRAPRSLARWRGQRLRIVALDAAAAAMPPEDPRLVTVRLRRAGGTPEDEGCTVASPEAWQALALIAGSAQLEGMQFIADRQGWLRARGAPGRAGWSDDDLVCRTERDTPPPPAAGPALDGLGALIARMDAEPVRYVKGGFVH